MRLRLSSYVPAAILSLAGLVLVSPSAAQDFRGTITGDVVDSQGLAMPGVSVTVQNLGTNLAHTVTTDAKGHYRIQHLKSGTYSVKMELQGFRTFVRKSLEVRVGDVINVDAKLETGSVEEVVEVTAAAPLLNTNSGVTGQVIDSHQIQELPLGDGTAYMLTRLAPGLSDTSDLHFSRPMDNANLGGIVTNGALGGNDFTIDGAPNRVSPNSTATDNNSGNIGFSPPSSAIAEFKVQTNSFDAQAGQTAGSVVNLALKSGTNAYHGTISYFNRDDARSATPLLTERAGAEKPTRDYNRFTATLTGPVVRNKTFFLVSYEYLLDVQPEPSSYTVPTALMRQGNLSEWSGLIYDPLTATGSNNQRLPFPGNIIPTGRINPIAAAYLQYYPEPNQSGLEDNYFTNQLRPYNYDAVLGRIDHNFNPSNNIFLTAYWNKRQEDRYNWAQGASNATGDGEINGFEVTHGFDNRTNLGVTLGYTSTLSSNFLLDFRAGFSKFGEWREPAQTFDPASLGWPASVTSLMGGYDYLPFFTFGGFSTTNANSLLATLGSQRSDWNLGFNRPFYNISFAPTVTRLWGPHTARAGYEFRYRRWDITNNGYGAGRYHFNGSYTRANNAAPLNNIAQSWAQFLLGLPTTSTNTVASPGSTSSQFEIAAPGDYSQTFNGFFIQDDWRVNRKLTLNLGLRIEADGGMSEAENRNLAGFDYPAANPIEPAATAAYARNPIPEIPVSQFAVKGGVLFADGAFYSTLWKVLPRANASYLLTEKTVIRGGIGLFSYPYYFDAANQAGFSQPTGVITTENNGTTFLTNLSNPIPGGALIEPTGSARGLATTNGLTNGTVVPSERGVPYYLRWQFGVQRELGKGWVVELLYVGARGNDLPVLRETNGLPIQYLSRSRTRDAAQESYLSAAVPNPFQGLLPGTGLNGSTIQRGQLLRPRPEFLVGAANGAIGGTGSIVTQEYVGSDQYDAGTISVQKSFSNGNSMLVTYTRSKLTDNLNYLNPSDGILEERTSPNDRPNRVTFAFTYRLPFGQGQKWGSDWKGFKNAALGGWQVSGTYQYQSGFPLTWTTNIYYDPTRDPKDLKSNIGEKTSQGIAGLDYPAWDITGFYIAGGPGRTDPNIVLNNNVRYFPSTLPNFRTDNLNLFDVGLYKSFNLPRKMQLQIRAEAINALNYTVLWNPILDPRNANFGFVNQDRNNAFDLQLGAVLTF